MKSIRSAALVLVTSGSLLNFGYAEEASPTTPTSDWQIILQALEATQPLPANEAPEFGNYYSAQFGPAWPPGPVDPTGLAFWPLGDGIYVYDDRNVDWTAVEAAAEGEAGLAGAASPMTPLSMVASSLESSYTYSNPIYFTNMAAIPAGDTTGTMVASFGIAGGTNNVPCDILMGTNVGDPVSQWTWVGIGYTSNNYTFSNQPPDQAFYILAKPQRTMTVGWGNDSVGQCDVPAGISNALMVAGGGGQSLALLSDGTVIAWGQNGYGEGSVPTNLAGVAMIAAGWYHDVALLTNGAVTAWGLDWHGVYNLTEVPSNLTNATVISAQALHSLALTSNGTVVAWGYGPDGEASVPANLSNVVAIAAGYQFNLAVRSERDGDRLGQQQIWTDQRSCGLEQRCGRGGGAVPTPWRC